MTEMHEQNHRIMPHNGSHLALALDRAVGRFSTNWHKRARYRKSHLSSTPYSGSRSSFSPGTALKPTNAMWHMYVLIKSEISTLASVEQRKHTSDCHHIRIVAQEALLSKAPPRCYLQ